MKKLMKVALLVMAMCLLLSGCQYLPELPDLDLPNLPFLHQHEWQDATCEAPKTCATCGETEGEALGHTWDDATCVSPKTCSVCSATEGKALGHTGGTASCTAKAVCGVCGTSYGELAQHVSKEDDGDCTTAVTCKNCDYVFVAAAEAHTGGTASCTAKAVCGVCGTSYGELAQHISNEDDDDCTTAVTCKNCDYVFVAAAENHTGGAAATCTTAQTCTVCGKEVAPATGHNFQANVVRPTCEAEGTITFSCANCGIADESAATFTMGKLGCTKVLTARYNSNKLNFITNCGADKMTPFKFLDFGDGDTCEVTLYIYNATNQILKDINLSWGWGMNAYASEETVGTRIPGTWAELNLAAGTGTTVTLTIPRECYMSNSTDKLTDGKNDSLGELVSYRDLGLRWNFAATPTGGTFIACLSDSVVTECLTKTYRNDNAAAATVRLDDAKNASSTNYTTYYDAFAAEYNKIYVNGYECIHKAALIKNELTAEAMGLGAYAAGKVTVSGVEYGYTELGDFGNGIQMRIKNGNTAALWNNTAFAAPITKIELVYSANKDVKYSNDDAFTFTFGTAADALNASVNLSTVAGTKTYTVTPDAATYTYFNMKLNLEFSFYWDSITIYLADGTTVSAS